MKLLKYICAASILAASVCALWSCNDDDENRLSDAVLASRSSLAFEAQGAAEKILTIYADADWVTEIPDWVTVSPTEGTGVMDVTVSVSENMRGGAMDNPRKAKLVFKGRTLASRAEVLITQDGDKYRDVKEYTVSELPALADETVISVPSALVVAVTTKGFVISDNTMTDNVFVSNGTKVAVGDKISLKGSKASDTQKLPTVVDCDELNILSSGATVTYPTPTDLTAQIDTYTSDKRGYVSVTGFFNGSTISVSEDAKYSVSVLDVPASLRLSALTGHNIKLSGYYAGLAEPVHRIMATVIEDKGAVEIVYFADDMEWMGPWTETGTGSTVENDGTGDAPGIGSQQVEGVSLQTEFQNRGYKFVYTPKIAIYAQKNYLKFGKTDYQAGITLPPMEVPSDVKAELSFDWAPMVGGTRKFDPVEILVIVTNGSNPPVEFGPFGHNFVNEVDKLSWLHATILLENVTIDKNTQITIRSKSWGDTVASTGSKVYQRWFIDNIKVIKVE